MTKRWLKSSILIVSLCTIACALFMGAVGCSSPDVSTPPDTATSPDSSSLPEKLGLIVIEGEIEAPDFTLPTMTGPEITLAELRDTPVVLNCWAIRCPPCKEELPHFDVAAKEYTGKVMILTVNLEDSVSKVKEFFGDNEPSYIVALDKNNQVASGYNTGYIPNTFFIDSQGIVRYFKVGGFTNEEQLLASIEALLNY